MKDQLDTDGLQTSQFSSNIKYDLDDPDVFVDAQRTGSAGYAHHRSTSLDWTALVAAPDSSTTVPVCSGAPGKPHHTVKLMDVVEQRVRQTRYASLQQLVN